MSSLANPDTICAIASAPGEGSVGLVRVSGKEAVSLVARLFQGKKGKRLESIPSHQVAVGKLTDPTTGKTLDEVLAVVMRGPHSYTGEDVVELSGHGNPRLLSRVVEVLIREGARLAERGEFTKRAFLNGKIDLTQAESVMDTVRSVTPFGMDMALSQLDGKLGKHLSGIRERMIAILAPIEACIDFPEEEVPEVPRLTLLEQVSSLVKEVREILKGAAAGRILREGMSAVIAGKPNVGKSSLLNALLREGRAIVTEVPGTTRDTISEWADVGGIPVQLIDTAGIRETKDRVEQIGISRSREALAKGDLLLLVLDRSVPLESDDYELLEIAKQKKSVVVLNKMDLEGPLQPRDVEKIYSGPLVSLSVTANQGLNQLEERIVKTVLEEGTPEVELPRLTRLRHQEGLERALSFLSEAEKTLQGNLPLDLVAHDLRGAALAIGEITGECFTEDLLNRIFSEFCVGK